MGVNLVPKLGNFSITTDNFPASDLSINEISNNTLRTPGINNNLAINILGAARDNLKTYNRIIDAVQNFNNNVAWPI